MGELKHAVLDYRDWIRHEGGEKDRKTEMWNNNR